MQYNVCSIVAHQSSAESRLSTPSGRTHPTMPVTSDMAKKTQADSAAALTTLILTTKDRQS